MPANKDVNEGSQVSSDSSTEEQEQDTVEETQHATESVETQGSDISKSKDKEIADNYRKALKRERERRKQAEAKLGTATSNEQASAQERLDNIQQSVDSNESDEDIAQRFYRTEANAAIARKMAEDENFRERMDLVINEMENNPKLTVDQADEKVRASLFNDIIQGSEDSAEVVTKAKQTIKPSATPEPETVKPSGNPIDDIIDGKADFDDAKEMGEALKKFRA